MFLISIEIRAENLMAIGVGTIFFCHWYQQGYCVFWVEKQLKTYLEVFSSISPFIKPLGVTKVWLCDNCFANGGFLLNFSSSRRSLCLLGNFGDKEQQDVFLSHNILLTSWCLTPRVVIMSLLTSATHLK